MSEFLSDRVWNLELGWVFGWVSWVLVLSKFSIDLSGLVFWANSSTQTSTHPSNLGFRTLIPLSSIELSSVDPVRINPENDFFLIF